jgi:hypothetical protein
VIYRRKADAASQLAISIHRNSAHGARGETNTDLCLLTASSVSMAEGARERALTLCAVYWKGGRTAAVMRWRVSQTYVPTRSLDPRMVRWCKVDPSAV